MEIGHLLVFLALYAYAWFCQSSLFYILLALAVIFTAVQYYVQFKNKVSLCNKIIPSFYLNHSLGAVLAHI